MYLCVYTHAYTKYLGNALERRRRSGLCCSRSWNCWGCQWRQRSVSVPVSKQVKGRSVRERTRVCIDREHTHSLAIGMTCRRQQQETDWEGEIPAPATASANFGSLLQRCKQTATPWFSVKRQESVYTHNRPPNFSSYTIFSHYTTLSVKGQPFLFVDLFYTFYVQQL